MLLFSFLSVSLAAEWTLNNGNPNSSSGSSALEQSQASSTFANRDALVSLLLKNIKSDSVTAETYDAACTLAENPTWLTKDEDRIEWADTLAVVKASASEEEKAAFVKAIAVVAATDDQIAEINQDLYSLGHHMAQSVRLGILRAFSVLRAFKNSKLYTKFLPDGSPDSYQMAQVAVTLHWYRRSGCDAVYVNPVVVKKEYQDENVIPGEFKGEAKYFQQFKAAESSEEVDKLLKQLKEDPSLSDSLLFREYQWIKILRLEAKYQEDPSEASLNALANHLEDVWKVAEVVGQHPYLWKRALPDLPQIRFIFELQKGAVDDIRIWELKQLFADTPHLHWCLWKIFFSSTDPNIWIPNLRTFLLKGSLVQDMYPKPNTEHEQ